MVAIDTRTRTYGLCLNIDGFVRNEQFPSGYRDVFVEIDRTLTPAEARTFLALEKAKGRKVIPVSAECTNPCKHVDRGCTGFDYAGSGCPGRLAAGEVIE